MRKEIILKFRYKNIEDEQGVVVMDKEQMKQRTKEFALRVIRLVE